MVAVTLELWAQQENWMMAQWMQLEDEDQEKMMDDKDMPSLYAFLF